MLEESKMRRDEEYEMQLFGFTSRVVCATLERVVDEKIQICCNKLIESIDRMNNFDEKATSTLRTDAKGLRRAYDTNSCSHKKTMEKCIRKLIAVPSNILLSEDQCQAISYPKGPREAEKYLTDVQSKVRKAQILQAALKDELQSIEKIEPQIGFVESLSTVIDNSSIQREVNTYMMKCVSTLNEFEDLVENDSNSETANVYRNDIYNVRRKELDLDVSGPNI